MSRRNEGRFPMSLRVSPETYARIQQAATETGRSLAQEMETRLEASFRLEDVEAAVERAFARRDAVAEPIGSPPPAYAQ